MDVEHLLQSVCELLSPRAREKGLEIAWTSETAGAPVMADEGRLRQILFNLAGNAVKFTERGGAILEARQSYAGDGHIWLRLSVRDSGPGVPESEQSRIFEEYARASGAGAQARHALHRHVGPVEQHIGRPQTALGVDQQRWPAPAF